MIDAALAIAVPFIAAREGFRSDPYQDSGGVWTIGFGSTRLADGSPVTANTSPLTRAEAEALLAAVLVRDLEMVRRVVIVPITDHAAAAFISFSYNAGMGAFETSTLLRDVNTGMAPELWSAQFSRWVHDVRGVVMPGLVKRRADEAALALTPDDVPAIPPAPAEDIADKLDDQFNPGA